MDAPHGRWRIVSHHSFLDVLIVEVEASSQKDAREICRRIVGRDGAAFTEILVYLKQETATASERTVRMRWTRASGYDAIMLTFGA